MVVQNGELWAVSAYFNPAGFARRLENFRTFRRRLAVPLIAVEVAFERDFELRPGDAEVLVQLRNPDVMWHKEAMLEIGFRHCPAACEAIAWLDADVFFERPDWPAAALDALAHAPVVQLSERVDHCAPGADSGGVLFSQRSAAAAIAAGGCAVDALSSLLDRDAAAVATGFAWAARREFLARHGLYTRSIAGGGDTALVCALYGCPEVCVAHHNLNAAQERSLRDWAAPLPATSKDASASSRAWCTISGTAAWRTAMRASATACSRIPDSTRSATWPATRAACGAGRLPRRNSGATFANTSTDVGKTTSPRRRGAPRGVRTVTALAAPERAAAGSGAGCRQRRGTGAQRHDGAAVRTVRGSRRLRSPSRCSHRGVSPLP